MRQRKKKGTKRVNFEFIRPDSPVGESIYRLMRELIDAHHDHLTDARIGLAWCTSWKPDRDGRVTLGKCKKASDLDREFVQFDFIILLKKSFWQDMKVTPDQRRALLDHELCHAGGVYDDRTGEPVYDERGRKTWRIIKHDIEEFASVAERYGTYKRDLEFFYAALNRNARAGFQPCENCRDTRPGWREVEDVTGVKREARCECWTAWSHRYGEAIAS